MQNEIPLYTADGQFCDWISEQRAARLDQLGLIRVVRHKKGRVARCILHQCLGAGKPARPSDYLGTRYSFREHLDCGHAVWALKPLRTLDEI